MSKYLVVCGFGKGSDLQERLVVRADAIALVQHAILDELLAKLLEDRLFVSGGHVGARALILSWICGRGEKGKMGDENEENGLKKRAGADEEPCLACPKSISGASASSR